MNAPLLIGKINTLADTDVPLLLYHIPSEFRVAESEGCLERGSITMSHLLCSTYQVELPELKEKKLPRMGKYTNAHLLCGKYQVELPELKEKR